MLSQIVGFLVPLLYFLGFTASLVFLTKKSFGKCLPLSMMLSAFLLFFSQLLLGTFNVGFWVGAIFAMLSVGFGIWRHKEWKEYKGLLFTYGTIAFLVVYILVFIYDLMRGFSVWDEFSHWGMMLKEMMRLDKFYSVDASNLMVHKDYPPIMQLFELFWMKLSGGYREAYALRAVHTFELSIFVPFIAEEIIEKKKIVSSILISVASMLSLALVILFFDQHAVFHTVYTDYAMAVVTAYLMVTIYLSEKIGWFEVFQVALGGSFLILLKQMGLPLYLMVLCFLAMVVYFRRKNERIEKKINFWRAIGVMMALLLPFVLWFVWGRMVDGVAQQFSLSSLSIRDFIKVLAGRGEEWQSYTVKKYLAALGQDNISSSYIQMSYVQGVVLAVGLFWILWKKFKEKLKKKRMVLLVVTLLVGAVGYSVAMLMLYVLAFGSYEGPILASFERYMGTYLIIMITTILLIVVALATMTSKSNIIYGICFICILITSPAAYKRLYPYFGRSDSYANYTTTAERLVESVGDDSKVFVVSQNVLGYHYYLQYFATPVRLNSTNYTWSTDKNDADVYFDEQILPAMIQYDYMLFGDVDENFNDLYCKKISSLCPIKNGDLFKVEINDDGVHYEYVNNLLDDSD